MTIDLADLTVLKSQVAGPVMTPSDEGYAAETFTWNLGFSQTPAVAVGASSAEDVVAAVRFAGAQGLPVAVLATGHGPLTAADGAVLINVRRLDSVMIDEGAATATVGGAAEWQAVTDAAAKVGLAPVSGSSPNVGVVGYTLGGGLSPVLGRRYGWASDHVLSLEIVTPDGELRVVTAESESDLFWAVRGGKSNFGVVVSMTFRLMPVTRFFGGGLYFDAEHAPAVLTEFRRLAELDDDQLTVSFAMLRMPPLPFVPEPLRGRVSLHVRFSYLGEAAVGAELIAPMRSLAPALIDTVGEMPYASCTTVHSDPVDPVATYDRSQLLSGFPADAAAALIEVAGAGADTSVLLVEVRQLGGALAREVSTPSAVSHRDAPFSLMVGTAGAPGQADAVAAELDRIMEAMQPWHHAGTMLNFLSYADAHPGRVASAYSKDTYEKLLDLKRVYDPAGLFRLNHTLTGTREDS
jgi:FAD/FMN-containing dehydrogenase